MAKRLSGRRKIDLPVAKNSKKKGGGHDEKRP
jgi:hypothetical protein